MNPARWRPHLIALGAAAIITLALFFRDAASMVVIWWTSSTFNHCFAIVPIVCWLVWQRFDELRLLTPMVWLRGLWLMLAAALLWVAGEAAGVGLLRHIALVLMIQAAILTILGRQVVYAILFPLAYLIFLIPFGEELVPLLQTLTAKICVFLLMHSHIPAKIDGIFITVPNGFYQVAAACSGVKFLIAMLAYGSLAANVCFKSVKRRAIFMVAAIVLPVLANGIRAFGTIYIGYLTNSNFARSFDHVVYGWFFFAFVMGVLMLVSWRWFDRKLGDPWLERLPAFTPTRFTPVQAALATLMIMLLPLVWTTAVARSGHIPVTHSIALPNVPGWQRIQMSDGPPWSPRFDGADHRLIGRYRNAAGETVDLAVALYGWQDERRKIIGYGHGAVDPDGPWRWTSDESAPAGGKAERIMGVGKVTRLVESFYVVGGAVSANPASIKWRTMAAKLTGSDQSATAVLISAQERDGYARAACDHFADALGPIEKLAAGFVATARGQ